VSCPAVNTVPLGVIDETVTADDDEFVNRELDEKFGLKLHDAR
jgi:hypothetical protein